MKYVRVTPSEYAMNYRLPKALGVWPALALLSLCPGGFAQHSSAGVPAPRLELPVIMRQKVVAGVTPVGAPVEAKLQIATLVSGTVVPQGAILSGHVEQSAKKAGDAPSRLKIKFESAHWKKGSAPLEVYFTGCYYPMIAFTDRDRNPADASYGSISRPMDPSDGSYPTQPGLKSGQMPQGYGPDVPQAVTTQVSSHWVRQPGANVIAETDGSISVTSIARDLRLDKDTTYLLANFALVNAAPSAKH